MSLGIAFKGPEGIVLAADSRVTLQATNNQTKQVLPAYYDNATKLLKVNKHDYIGAVTYGAGAIGLRSPRTAHSYIPEFEQELGEDRVSVEEFSTRLSDFFLRQWRVAKMPENDQVAQMVFLVGGYDEGAPYGRVFEMFIPGAPQPVERHAGPEEFGLVWGGQREFTDRLIGGFDAQVPDIAQQILGITDEQKEQLASGLKTRLQAQIPFAFLPLQDCVDLSILLLRTTVAVQNWIIGIRGVGGPIDVATITRMDGFKSVQQKTILGERH